MRKQNEINPTIIQKELDRLKLENTELRAELDQLEPAVKAYSQSVLDLKQEMLFTMKLILTTDNITNVHKAAQLTVDRWTKQATKH